MSNTTEYPAVGQSIAGWSNGPDRITAVDNSVAVSDAGASVCTILARDFGFSIPEGDVLVGLKVEVLCGWKGGTNGGIELSTQSVVSIGGPE